MKSLRALGLLTLLLVVGCGDKATNEEPAGDGGSGTPAKTSGKATGDGEQPTIAFVTNGIASFWDIADKGAKDGGKEFGAVVKVIMPPKGVADQKRMVEEVLAGKIDGVAISPIDPDNQGDLMDEIAKRTKLITHDSDAPKSKRLCYIGMDNYTAGRMCGQLVKKAMPKGGTVMIFVGRLSQANARLRRQGVIDELMDRSQDAKRYDEPSKGEIKGKTYTILDTRTDEFDRVRAKSQAQDAIAKYPNLGCMIGLFAYNPPLLLAAAKEAGKLGKIKVVAFDEADETLKGIQDGHCFGTIVQNPYKYGYESVKMLAALARGDNKVIPKGAYMDIPARTITKANVVKFWDELKKLTKK